MKIELKRVINFIWVFALMISLKGTTKLQFYTDVYAWYPDGKVKSIPPGLLQIGLFCHILA